MNELFVSFYVITYNQSKYVEQAMKAALAQDYSLMEIIISDDCSTDDTWKKIQGIASAYTGPHRLIIRQNAKNLGVSAHINEIWKICSGNWIFASAGDDFSVHGRVAKTMAVVSRVRNVKLVQTWLSEVDENGVLLYVNKLGDCSALDSEPPLILDISDRCLGNNFAYHGAALAYSREIIDSFPRLTQGAIFEDNIVNVRAELLGKVCLVREPLVYHRNHSGQLTNTRGKVSYSVSEYRKAAAIASNVYTFSQNLKDVSIAKENRLINDETFEKLFEIFNEKLRSEIELQKIYTNRWPLTILHFVRLVIFRGRVSKDAFIRAILPKLLYKYFYIHFRDSVYGVLRNYLTR